MKFFAVFAGWWLPAVCLAAIPRPVVPPFQLPREVVMKTDLVYATVGTRALHLDLFLPKAGTAPFPAVVYIHGGGWRAGSRTAFYRQAADMARLGFAGACVEYRFSGEARYPASVYDVKAAVRWIRANAGRYHIDPDRIGAVGGSSGGHLAGMLGTTNDDPRFEGNEGNLGFSSRVSAVAAFNPAMDLVELGSRPGAANTVSTQYMGMPCAERPVLWRDASPMYHVSAKSAAFLFLHGNADTTVPYTESVRMMAELKAVGVHAELFTAPGANHAFFNSPPWFEPTLKRMEAFFRAELG